MNRTPHTKSLTGPFYGQSKGHAHRYQSRGDNAHVGAGLCIGIGGLRIDRAVASQILEAVSDRAVEAAPVAADQVDRSHQEIVAALERKLEATRYEASLAERRNELVDPAKRHVARELEARWNGALERVSQLEQKREDLFVASATRLTIDRAQLFKLAHDLPAAQLRRIEQPSTIDQSCSVIPVRMSGSMTRSRSDPIKTPLGNLSEKHGKDFVHTA